MIDNDIIILNNDAALVFQIYENKSKKIETEINKIKTKAAIQKVAIKYDQILLVFSLLITIITVFYAQKLIKKGFKDWLVKVQIPLDKKLTNETRKVD